jgi:hypothetical protein
VDALGVTLLQGQAFISFDPASAVEKPRRNPHRQTGIVSPGTGSRESR